ncbi:hypothetical protein T484DRAFT_1874390 [Baffinella frigidus]|nr:hypothetical protein T484DRAFT_1874390 [Cryptophyta sp. CCMP2293]
MRGGEGDTAKLIAETEEFVRKEIAACDASHDWGHVDRVRRGALKIAALERLADAGGDVLVVELAALMHDVRDYKYSGSDVAGVDAARAFLAERGVPDATVAAVCHVIEHVGFQKEKKECGGAFPAGEAPLGPPTELACVQDADRLDAIGAVGIARPVPFH